MGAPPLLRCMIRVEGVLEEIRHDSLRSWQDLLGSPQEGQEEVRRLLGPTHAEQRLREGTGKMLPWVGRRVRIRRLIPQLMKPCVYLPRKRRRDPSQVKKMAQFMIQRALGSRWVQGDASASMPYFHLSVKQRVLIRRPLRDTGWRASYQNKDSVAIKRLGQPSLPLGPHLPFRVAAGVL